VPGGGVGSLLWLDLRCTTIVPRRTIFGEPRSFHKIFYTDALWENSMIHTWSWGGLIGYGTVCYMVNHSTAPMW